MTHIMETVGCPLHIGKGLFWEEETQTLFYADMFPHTIYCYRLATNENHSVKVDTEHPLSQITKIHGEKNKFVIALKNHLAIVTWDGASDEPLRPEHFIDVEANKETTRLNGVKCDPSNRIWTGTVWAGTLAEVEQEKGSLYMINKDKTVSKKATEIGLSNGPAWNNDKNKMYYIDSLAYTVDAFDYDDVSGSISNRTTIFSFKEHNIKGMPVGVTTDQEGMLWVTSFGGAKVVRVDPNTGKLLQTLEIPAPQVTSVQFGGPNFDILFVTTAKYCLSKEEENRYPLAGHTFLVKGLGVKGTPSVPVKL